MQSLSFTHSLSPHLLRPSHSLSSLRKNPSPPNPQPHTPKPVSISRPASNLLPSSAPAENDLEPESFEDGFEIEVKKVEGKKNRRLIRSRIRVDVDLETVWGVLTDYEGLADFIPGLAVSELIEKGEKFARLYQVGQQDLALGFKFDAKGVLDCYERDVEHFPSGRRRDIEFKMVEGDFKTFEGRWSIEQINNNICNEEKIVMGQAFQTTLSYFVELEPKLRLPVRLLEGRLCKEVKKNLFSVRDKAQRVQNLIADALTANWDTEEN